MTMYQTSGPPAATPGEEPEARVTGSRTPRDVAELFDIAAGEKDAVQRLNGCVAQLTRAQAAKEALSRLTPAEVRQALEYRHRRCVHAQPGLLGELGLGESR